MPVLQIYKRPVALDRDAHKELRITSENKLFFAKTCQIALIAMAELNQAIKEFPLVFIKENDTFLPVVIMGLQPDQNLFVDESGEWTARYIPAFLRRYPFIPALNKDNDEQMTVCIDDAAECINRDRGEQLFIDGKNSEFLDNVIIFLQDYKTQTEATIEQVKQLAEAGLLTEQKANFRTDNGQTFDLNGFFSVDAEKLSKLSPEISYRLFQSGSLQLAYLHIASMDNFSRMIGLLSQRLMDTAKKEAVKPALSIA